MDTWELMSRLGPKTESGWTFDGRASRTEGLEEGAIRTVMLLKNLRDYHRVTSNVTSLPSRLFICVSA